MTRVTLRLSEDMHARIVELAERDHRSLNGELLWLLEQALKREKK